jgi:predicted permease
LREQPLGPPQTSRELQQQEPERNAGLTFVVSPWRQDVEPEYELTLVLILVAVGLVLLIACADVASLLLSRAVHRQKEIAIRAALGAGFWRILRQLLAESFVLAALAGAAGLAVAHYALRLLSQQLAALPVILPRIHHVELDARALAASMILCVAVAIFCSLAPVLFASRTDPQTVFRGSQGSSPKGSARLFNILVASQAAFAFLLLAGSGLMVRSVIRLQQADKGFRPDNILTIKVPVGSLTGLPPARYQTRLQQIAYYDELLGRIANIPGVDEVALVNNAPLSRINTSLTMPLPNGRGGVLTRIISPRYFAAMGIPLLAGRLFTEQDHTDALPVAVINEYLAQQLFPDRDPIGQYLPSARAEKGLAVIGVVKNSWLAHYDQPMEGEMYVTYRQVVRFGFASTFVIRTQSAPGPLAEAIRKEVWAVDPEQPILNVETMNQVVANAIWRPRFSAWILSVLGGLALLLTAAGVYGVVAYTAARRMREVGIRIALGASPEKIIAAVLRDAMLPLAAGVAVGAAITLPLTRLLSSLLYGISSTDPVTYIGAGALLLATGFLASVRPAWKAAACEPLSVLRTE